MPRYCLALTIGVGGEDQGVVFFQRVGNGFDMLAAVIADLPFHGKFMLGIDRPILRRQVTDVAI